MIKALQVLGQEVQENVLLENPDDHDHKQWQVDVAIHDEIGFKWNEQTWIEDLPLKQRRQKI